MNDVELVFIWIGKSIPKWLKPAVIFASENSGCNVTLLHSVESLYIPNIKLININKFYQRSKLLNNVEFYGELKFRNEFWLKTTERFLILRDYMIHYNIHKCFHAECDNLIFNIELLSNQLDNIGEGLFAPRDSLSRAVASLIYINSINSINRLCNNIFSNKGKVNDMYLLGEYLSTSIDGYSLPIESCLNNSPKWNYISIDTVGGIFDANSLGQYLFGVDPRNDPYNPVYNLFINENLTLNLKDMKFDYDGTFFYLKYGVNKVKIFNLHVHSKNLEIISNRKKIYKIINSTNKQKKIIVSHNLRKIIYFFLKFRNK